MAKHRRNDPCPCGSGKKYKRCCLEKERSTSPGTPSSALKEANVNARKLARKMMGQLEEVAAEGDGTPRVSPGAELLAFKINFFHTWLDEPNQRLGGETPRVAVKDPRHKSELLKLLDELEKAELKLPKKERYSFKKVRKELGLLE